MADEQLYTLRQLADQLKLPESTVRYYRDAFLDHIPSVGTGRRRRYPAQAVAVLRSIAKAYAAGRPRGEIIEMIHGRPESPAVTITSEPQRTVPMEEVSNLDLLAAILDGEREQRDALWQMAKEIVRLTEVLEGQDRVLGEIAHQAGITSGSAPSRPLLERAEAPLLHAAPAPAAPPIAQAEVPVMASPGAPLSHAAPITPIAHVPPAAPAAAPTPPAPPAAAAAPAFVPFKNVVDDDLHEIDPLPRYSGSESLEKLRAELESERALVERLRESKLALEHRAADAEAALEERKTRRPSVIRRILGGSGEEA